MDSFRQSVEDLGTIRRVLELPQGHDVAAEMLRELAPFLDELRALAKRDATGGIQVMLDYAADLELRLSALEASELKVAARNAIRCA
jgi:hypothetical protein